MISHINTLKPQTTPLIRWFKFFGVFIASERQQRTLAKELVSSDLVAEKVAFTGGEEVREVPQY